jgi:hypothetical protein
MTILNQSTKHFKYSQVQRRAEYHFRRHMPLFPDPEALTYAPIKGIVPGIAGKFAIRTSDRKCIWPVISGRSAILNNQQPISTRFATPTAFTSLYGPEGRIASDEPSERYAQFLELHGAHGDVLLSGLGLGTAMIMLLKSSAVNSVTVVEKEVNVLRLAMPLLDLHDADRASGRLSVVCADIFSYLENIRRVTTAADEPVFTCAYHDMWLGENEWAAMREDTVSLLFPFYHSPRFADSVVPLFRASRRADIERVHGLGLQEMQYQLFTGLFKAALLSPEAAFKPYRVFLTAMRKDGFELGKNADEELLADRIWHYLTGIGDIRWEITYDWEAL